MKYLSLSASIHAHHGDARALHAVLLEMYASIALRAEVVEGRTWS